MPAPHDWPRIDATGDPRAVAAEVRASSRHHRCDAFELTGVLDDASARQLAAALGPLDGTYRFRARGKPPLRTATVRAMHRAGFVHLQLEPGSGYACLLQTVRACDEIGVDVGYSLATLRESAPKPFSLAVPALVHLTPPSFTPEELDELDKAKKRKKNNKRKKHNKGRLRRALAHWTAVHGTGLLTAQRGPAMLRIVDSRRTAWAGSASARPRIITLRNDDVAIFDQFRVPRTLSEVVERCPDVMPGHLTNLLTSLVRMSLLVPCGRREGKPRLLSLVTFAPPWWERAPLDSRPPPEDTIPADSTVWQPFLRTQSWEYRPARPPERHLPVVQEPS